MPTISTFYGIVIQMFFRDHEPAHSVYGGKVFLIGIAPITVLRGKPSPRVRSMLFEWTALHHQELIANWERVRKGEPPLPVDPLD